MKLRNAVVALAAILLASIAPAQVSGSGTKGAIPVWTSSTSLGNSPMASVGSSIGIGTNKPSAKLDVQSSSSTEPAITGSSTTTTGTAFGIYGLSGSQSGIGVTGQNYSTTAGTQSAIGVFGLSSNPNYGQGVNGTNPATTGTGIGVAASSAGDNGVAVNAEETSTTATGYTIAYYGTTSAPNSAVATFVALAYGNIIVGQSGPSNADVFRVDGTGKGFFDGGTQTGGADFAESVAVAKEFTQHEPGDLLVVDTVGKRQLKLSTQPYSTLVAGVYSTKPGVLATPHKIGETAKNEIPLAIVGIVPCKVSAENGSIRPGDLLVSSSTPGHAMKGTDRSRMLGAVIGKALEPLAEGTSVIQVLVTLQ